MTNLFTKKYDYVARRVNGFSGVILDVGARDRILEKYLVLENLRYLSADIVPGHDYTIDLENPLTFGDQAFDFVVALDVLEHLEFIHDALRELIRITRDRLFISLPNMSCLSFRMQFLLHGNLSGKYNLLPEYLPDRHRWLTTYHQSINFIGENAKRLGCSVVQYDIQEDASNIFGRLGFLLPAFLLPNYLRTYTTVFEIKRYEPSYC